MVTCAYLCLYGCNDCVIVGPELPRESYPKRLVVWVRTQSPLSAHVLLCIVCVYCVHVCECMCEYARVHVCVCVWGGSIVCVCVYCVHGECMCVYACMCSVVHVCMNCARMCGGSGGRRVGGGKRRRSRRSDSVVQQSRLRVEVIRQLGSTCSLWRLWFISLKLVSAWPCTERPCM